MGGLCNWEIFFIFSYKDFINNSNRQKGTNKERIKFRLRIELSNEDGSLIDLEGR